MYRALHILIILFLSTSLLSCSLWFTPVKTQATGYLSERGVIRLWQRDSSAEITKLVSIFSAFDDRPEVETEYTFDHERLISLNRYALDKQKNGYQIRFDTEGNVAFMQQQLSSHREALTHDEIALAQFEAQRQLKLSQQLNRGHIVLRQAQWKSGQQLQDCFRHTMQYNFNAIESQQLHRQAEQGAVYVAWLDAPEGQQLLLITARNLCQQVPLLEDE